MLQSRLAAARQRLASAAAGQPLDAVLVGSDHNRRHLSGFTGSAGFLLISKRAAVLLTDFRYVEQAAGQAPEFEVVKIEGLAPPAIVEQVKRIGVQRVGFESDTTTVDAYHKLQAALGETAPGAELVPLTGFGETIREAKDAMELAVIRRAVEIADRALERVTAALVPGVTEREAAWRLEVSMREQGADAVSFPIIVAAGPNGAMPHHRPSSRPIQTGEPIVIDMGCVVDGYCSDMTRTVVLGEPDARFWEVYRTVLRAQQACEDGLRAGMLGKDGDRLARDVIEGAGHGEHFGHGTGHGVGLAVHESPYLSMTRGEMPVLDGAVVTVEPGIYLPGWGGIRIEDMVVVGQTRCQVLTTAHKFPVLDLNGR